MSLLYQRRPFCMINDSDDLGTSFAARPDNVPLSNSAANEQLKATPKDAVLYMTLNSTTHHTDEIPETLSALNQAEKEGLGHRELIPLSDPYNLGSRAQHDTYDETLGKDRADKITFWHDDPKMKEGQVRIGDGKPMMLGTENLDLSKPEDAKVLGSVRDNWDTLLEEMGMDDKLRAQTIEALLGSVKDPKKLASGDGATNELLQYVMTMYRAEQGEFNVKSIVMSGHHWNSGAAADGTNWGHGLWGEFSDRDAREAGRDPTSRTYRADHEYYNSTRNDGRAPGGDFFGLQDVASFKSVFPKAYSQVESVQFAACNTYDLGMTNQAGETISTDPWLQGTFENIERASYWEGLAPLAATGASSNGEFQLDDMRADAGKGGWRSVSSKRNGSNQMHRSELDANGVLTQIPDAELKKEANSYGPKGANQLRTRNEAYWSSDKDRKKHLYSPPK